jgi:hypothetical protein
MMATSETASWSKRASSTSLPRDLDAASVYDVFDAVYDVEVALLVETAEVPRVEPAALEGLFGLVRLLPVADHQVWGAVDDLASLAGRNVVHLRADDPGLDQQGGASDRGQPLLGKFVGLRTVARGEISLCP